MNRRIAFAVAAMSTGQVAVYVARPTTSYRLLGLGYGGTAVGLVAAAYAVLPLLLAIPLGRRADRRRGARLVVGGCLLEVGGCLLLALGRSAATLAAASGVVGLGHLALALGAQAVIARESSNERHDERFALLAAGVSIGQLLGPLLAGLLLSGDRLLVGATSRALLVAAAVAGLATILALVSERGGAQRAATGPARTARVHEILRTRGVAAAIFASVAALAATDLFTAYLPVLGEQRGIGPAVVGTLLALRAGASLASRLGLKRLVRRIGRERLIAASAGAAAAGFVGLTFTSDVGVLAALALLIGLALGFAQPLSMTVVVQLVPEHARASALAVRLTGNRLGQVAAPAAAGLVTASAGASSVFWMTGGLLAASAVAAQRPKGPQPVAEEVERRCDDDRDRLGGLLAEPQLDEQV